MDEETDGGADGLIDGLRVRHDGWTPARQRTFLRALSETGCVRDACARSGISNTSAYRMKKRSAEFSEAWERALKEAMPTIEQAAYDRAVLGWDEPVFQGGRQVGVKKRYSDSLLRLLLQREAGGTGGSRSARPGDQKALVAEARRAAKAAGGYFETRASQEEVDRTLERKLDALDRRLKQHDAEARAIEAQTSGTALVPADAARGDAAEAGTDGNGETRARLRTL
jgi:hypothetical protein